MILRTEKSTYKYLLIGMALTTVFMDCVLSRVLIEGWFESVAAVQCFTSSDWRRTGDPLILIDDVCIVCVHLKCLTESLQVFTAKALELG